MKVIRLLFLALALVGGGSYAAPVLQIENGKLAGAVGVNVDGALYNVHFVDGTCYSAFRDCSPYNFFHIGGSGFWESAASEALIDTVFVDSPQGLFDSFPQLTVGCSYEERCNVMTP